MAGESALILRDFDWSVRIVQASDTLANVAQPLVSLTLFLRDGASGEESKRMLEMDIEEAKTLLADLQKVDAELRRQSSTAVAAACSPNLPEYGMASRRAADTLARRLAAGPAHALPALCVRFAIAPEVKAEVAHVHVHVLEVEVEVEVEVESTSKGKGKGDEEASSFTVEGLFDYINESAASLARVISLERKEDNKQHDEDGDNPGGWEAEDLRPRTMSVHASIKNRKSGQRVRFHTEVEVFPLPSEEGQDAWLSRRGHWGAAPEEDRYWSKSTNSFKPSKDPVAHPCEESSSDEEGPVLDHTRDHRDSVLGSFWETIKPLFQLPDRSATSSTNGSSDDLDLEVEIELVEGDGLDTQNDDEDRDEDSVGDTDLDDDCDDEDDVHDRRRHEQESAAHASKLPWSKSLSKRSSVERKANAGASQAAAMSGVDHVYPPTRKRFAYKIPSEERRARAADEVLKSHVLGGKLSGSQASAAASAGKVLVLRGPDGVAFGAAVKRKVQLKTGKKSKTKHSRPKAPEGLYERRRRRRGETLARGRRGKSAKKRPSLRSPGIGFSMRPRYIFIFFVLPLILIGVDDMAPFFEDTWYFLTHSNEDYKVRMSQPVSIPIWLRIFYPTLRPESQVLKNTLRMGSFVIEFGGLLVLLQFVYQLVNLFRVGQSVIEVHVSDAEDSDEDSDYDDSDESESNQGQDYSYLFKWQPSHHA
ncbi:COMM domain-containing protein 8 [Hondaea fermentalgiana]|uniref:COMM domain-containing protein 8 n=1 Tax=Hondaea fermentalgiana TaxID=2315210 RepID=A0A2R5GPG1_9STRA|nr:COMM domain-containing protein 8 [Hondaea fermentalgiana]|eukprot:GBG32766.1 COMM domain-containing protein 8 [Hondaea fermentalgiana]